MLQVREEWRKDLLVKERLATRHDEMPAIVTRQFLDNLLYLHEIVLDTRMGRILV
jgi:hypothetical protein